MTPVAQSAMGRLRRRRFRVRFLRRECVYQPQIFDPGLFYAIWGWKIMVQHKFFISPELKLLHLYLRELLVVFNEILWKHLHDNTNFV